MLVGVSVGVTVGVRVGVFVGVSVGLDVGVFVGVGVSVGVRVGVFVGVWVGVDVGVFVGVGVQSGAAAPSAWIMMAAPSPSSAGPVTDRSDVMSCACQHTSRGPSQYPSAMPTPLSSSCSP